MRDFFSAISSCRSSSSNSSAVLVVRLCLSAMSDDKRLKWGGCRTLVFSVPFALHRLRLAGLIPSLQPFPYLTTGSEAVHFLSAARCIYLMSPLHHLVPVTHKHFKAQSMIFLPRESERERSIGEVKREESLLEFLHRTHVQSQQDFLNSKPMTHQNTDRKKRHMVTLAICQFHGQNNHFGGRQRCEVVGGGGGGLKKCTHPTQRNTYSSLRLKLRSEISLSVSARARLDSASFTHLTQG